MPPYCDECGGYHSPYVSCSLAEYLKYKPCGCGQDDCANCNTRLIATYRDQWEEEYNTNPLPSPTANENDWLHKMGVSWEGDNRA